MTANPATVETACEQAGQVFARIRRSRSQRAHAGTGNTAGTGPTEDASAVPHLELRAKAAKDAAA